MEIVLTRKEVVFIKDALDIVPDVQLEQLKKVVVREELGGNKIKFIVDDEYICKLSELLENLTKGFFFSAAGTIALLKSSVRQLDTITDECIKKNEKNFEDVAKAEKEEANND